jgi:hypothetical protein
MMIRCCTDERRFLIMNRAGLNGLDTLEVLDAEAPPGSPRQRTLLLRFLKPAPALTREQFEITGGERITDVIVTAVARGNAANLATVFPAEAAYVAALPAPDHILVLRTSSSGDYSNYRLHIVASPAALAPPAGIDPVLAHVDFSFKVECPSEFDCAPQCACPEPKKPTPRINYLAKDYKSFRRLMLDRMAETLPRWQERNAADLGVALVEMLAYVGDHLSYAQDAVGAEAYLGTARRRVSIRRHARLVDYPMHDGVNARALVQVRVSGGPVTLPKDKATFFTSIPGTPPVIRDRYADTKFDWIVRESRPAVFEPMQDTVLWQAHNEIRFYTWGEAQCCLAKGATRATLAGALPQLAKGHILVFRERISPTTGAIPDANPANVHAVRLVDVLVSADPATNPPTPLTEIRWDEQDALPFALCLSSVTAPEYGANPVSDVSIALGNIVLTDHGMRTDDVALGTVPQPHLYVSPDTCNTCETTDRTPVPPRFNPRLPDTDITQAAPAPTTDIPAASVFTQDLRRVLPAMTLSEPGQAGLGWRASRDLLASDANDQHFVLEVEGDGTARVRFGDGRHGRRPLPGTVFSARYRIGTGSAGNVGAGAIVHIATDIAGIVSVSNPLGARGGLDAEASEVVRVAAPQAFRTQERAVTPEDYAAIALRFPGVQRAAATFRWNGHGHTVFVTVDRTGGRALTAEFEAGLIAFFDRYRMAGYDLEIDEPRFVPIEIDMLICVKPAYFRAQVKRAAIETLGSRSLADGRQGLFHPDRLSFAEPVYLSPIIAAVQAIDGVENVTIRRFQRQQEPDPLPLATGILPIGRLEIAQLANDASFPDRGRLIIETGGGK